MVQRDKYWLGMHVSYIGVLFQEPTALYFQNSFLILHPGGSRWWTKCAQATDSHGEDPDEVACFLCWPVLLLAGGRYLGE